MNREEWTPAREELLIKWRTHISEMHKLHDEAGIRLKKKHYLIGIPTYMVPLFMTFIQCIFAAIAEENSSTSDKCLSNFIETIINGALFLVSSILSLIYTLFDLGTKSTLHFLYSARYYELIIRIDSELSKVKEFRTLADIFMTEIKYSIDKLNENAPSFI